LLGGIVVCFRFGRLDVADQLKEAAVVEPVDLLQGGELDSRQVVPGAASTDHLGLEQAVDHLRQGIVVGITDTADRGLDTGPEQTFRVPNGKIVPAPCRYDG
jgi:hypothetical protein